MNVFTFTDPDGGKHVRRSKTRTYSHAILVKDEAGRGIVSCCGEPLLLRERLNYWSRFCGPNVVAAPAD